MTYEEIVQTVGKKIKPTVFYYDSNNNIVEINRDFFVSAKPNFKCNLIGTLMKGFELELKIELPNTAIYFKNTVKYDSYIAEKEYGPYYFKETPTYNADNKTYTHIMYDAFIKAMIPYEPIGIDYPCTIDDYFLKLVETLELTTNIIHLPNGDKILNSDIFADINFTYRDVFDDIGKATATLFELDDLLVKRCVFGTNKNIAIIDDDILKNSNIDFGIHFGPINSIVLSRSADSDNIFLDDSESIGEHGRQEYKISDCQIMNDDNRSDYLPELLNELSGIEYDVFDTELTGYGGFFPLQKVRFNTGGKQYNSYIFNNEIEITQGYSECIYTDIPGETITDYSAADNTDKKINQVNLIVNKQEKKITATANKADDAYSLANELEETVEGLTNRLSVSGGINYIKDSLGVLNDGSWLNNNDEKANIESINYPSAVGLSAIVIKNTLIKQRIRCKNGDYTLSFSFEKISPTSTLTIKINDNSYQIAESGDFKQIINVTTNIIDLTIVGSTSNTGYIYDLILNEGKEKKAWEQNQDETTTDTVKIGKGIEVSSNIQNTTSRMDADGFRVISNTTRNVVLAATDKGTETNEFKSKSTSNVNGVLYTRVGNQTWLNGVDV